MYFAVRCFHAQRPLFYITSNLYSPLFKKLELCTNSRSYEIRYKPVMKCSSNSCTEVISNSVYPLRQAQNGSSKREYSYLYFKYFLNLCMCVIFVCMIKTASCYLEEEEEEEAEEKQSNDKKKSDVIHELLSSEILCKSNTSHKQPSTEVLSEAIKKSRHVIYDIMTEFGIPGLSIAVSVNGKVMWAEGMGYSNIENRVSCTPNTVMRIASISKTLTAVAAASLIEQGKLNIDAPVQNYLPDFPVKTVNGEEVVITTRHLLSHQSGIRHYKVKEENNDNDALKKEIGVQNMIEIKPNESSEEKRERLKKLLVEKLLSEDDTGVGDRSEFDLKEYYIKENFLSVSDSLQLFAHDDLFFKPGERYLYSTHAFTLISAVIEGASGKSFTKVMNKLFQDLGLENTKFEIHKDIIYNRASFYRRNKRGKLENAPYVNNSYKWGGGGFISNVKELVKFGNAILYSYQQGSCKEKKCIPGFLESSTVKQIWKAQRTDFEYGLGWGVIEGGQECAFCKSNCHTILHTGEAVGCSSVLYILPIDEKNHEHSTESINTTSGIVVAILCNMQEVNLSKVAREISQLFCKI